ncbi:tetratricopeptide repeat protein [Streptomyces sp. Qhu-G9]|uniref:tetratricopeptide repeat protein n=1 Tax=Streptomyces sp. Qhu-G9 TaxID=3452799 RepID=UPI0022AC45C4|nr:tetratricopeptide repeat protein [Streptomyces aurantiacus]WAU82531.1 tetratricopeptide repeat protein [Streptomyces aurantiacus]
MTSRPVRDDHEPVTTNGTIALVNLSAQIDSLATQGQRADSTTLFAVAQQAVLVDLLALRGHLLGRVADYEHAAQLAERLVCEAPGDSIALLARARTRATLHRFAEAMTDLDAAGRAGAAQATLDGERAAILQAVGCYAEAQLLLRKAAPHQSDFTMLSALAVLQAERHETAEAEQVFGEARRSYRGVSPFPLAQLDFRRGVMWMREGDLPAARAWFEAARRRVPGYAPATGHLAEVDLLLGDPEAAVAHLRPLVETSDDPEYSSHLALVLRVAGRYQEAQQWRDRAAERYDELVLRHPEAYADHAADFWLMVGSNVDRGIQLALQTLVMRQTTRSYALVQRARAASNQPAHHTP